jgi:hypothetical protein
LGRQVIAFHLSSSPSPHHHPLHHPPLTTTFSTTTRRLKEAQNINRSLSALGDVMAALEQKAAHVPFRNSKLTYLLQVQCGVEGSVYT